MKHKKLLDKLIAFFNSDEREKQNQKDDVAIILKKLKKRERKLKEKLAIEEDEQNRNKLQQHIDIVYAQRKKGITIYKDLK